MNLLILLILSFFIIYLFWDLFVLIQIIIWTIVYFISNFLIGINPVNMEYRIIRIMSLFVIIFILWYNYQEIPISTMTLLPFSMFKVTHINDISTSIITGNKTDYCELELFTKDDISSIEKFLNNLKPTTNYVVNVLFIPNKNTYKPDHPQMTLCNPILLNKSSSSDIISRHIINKIDEMIDIFYLDDSIIHFDENQPVILLIYTDISII